jgi:putative N6-adenine-specific DNA methylase
MSIDYSKYRIIAKTFHGLEEVLSDELRSIGANKIEIHTRAVSFIGTQELVYVANLNLRTALRILVPIHQFYSKNENDLYNKVQNIDWSNYINARDSFAIDSVVYSDVFRHSKYIALKVKDAIVDQIRDRSGKRPSVNISNPDQRINIHIYKNQCTLSLDSSGESLHKRGYRHESSQAPLNEVLGAGLVLLSGWQKDCTFIDPMCGSGTILIEASMFAYNLPPGILRKSYGFMNWSDYNKDLWNKIREGALKGVRKHKYLILGSDISSKAVEATRSNMEIAGLGAKIKLEKRSFNELSSPGGEGILIMNPPYGERMQKIDINHFYKNIGDQLKQAYNGFDAWIFSSNKEALKNVGLRTSKKLTLYNGPLETKFHKYSMYSGSKSSSIDRSNSN